MFHAFAEFGTQRPNLVGDPELAGDERTKARLFEEPSGVTRVTDATSGGRRRYERKYKADLIKPYVIGGNYEKTLSVSAAGLQSGPDVSGADEQGPGHAPQACDGGESPPAHAGSAGKS